MSTKGMKSDDEINGEDNHGMEFYDWVSVPNCYPEDRKTGVTFKGESEEYKKAHSMIWELLNKKGSKLLVNDREVRVLDNAPNKPIKLEVKPIKGPAGKANIKIYKVNKNGSATMMIQKPSGCELLHVKTLAFKVVKYLLDGIIDGVLSDSDLEMMKIVPKSGNEGGCENLTCDICDKSFKTKNGLNIHKARMHINSLQQSNIEEVIINEDGLDCVKMDCSDPVEHSCKKCEFKTIDECALKRHISDKHVEKALSSTPKSKRRKKTDIDTIEQMDVDDTNDLLLARSQMWDNKIVKKRKKEEEEEKLLKRKLEKMEKGKDKKAKIVKNKKILKKLSLKSRKRMEMKGVITDQLKTYLAELPSTVKDLIGDGHVLYPVKGDGACGLRTGAAWIFQDQTLGPYLAREVNRIFVENWAFRQDYFTIPFIRNVKSGKRIEKNSKEELFEYLMNSEEGAFMWRGEEDFTVLCSLYKFNIKIITLNGESEPSISYVEPNPVLMRFSDFPEGKVPDMMILHQKDVHYDLIVHKDSLLATEGGLDYQRVEQKKQEESVKQGEKSSIPPENVDNDLSKNPSCILDQLGASNDLVALEENITKLENKICCMEEKISELEAENMMLRRKKRACYSGS